MVIITKHIKTPKGFAWRDSHTSEGKTTIIFKRRGKLGKLLKTTKKVVVKHPKNSRLTRIENNKPIVGTIEFRFIVKQRKK